MTDFGATGSALSATRAMAERVAAMRAEDLPADAVEMARQTLLDWLGVTLAGTREPLARILRDEAQEQGGRPVATIIGGNFKTGTQQAALINGATGHALDYDDAHFLATVHSGVTVISGMLALTEQGGASGRDFVAALTAGFEAIGMGAAFIGERHYRMGFHSTGTIGSLGSAAACANLLGLDADRTAVALGIAATQAAGLRAMFGTMTKPLHAGKAAQNGVVAATLAARGFTANPEALETALGFGATHSPDFDPHRPMPLAPRGYYLHHNIFKFHAACFLTHAPIECALELRARPDVTARQIAQIRLRIRSDARDVCGKVTPRSGLEAKFSLHHCLAAALAGHDTAALETFSDALVTDPALVALRDKVTIDYSPDTPRGQAELAITLIDGQLLSAQFDSGAPLGDLARQRARVENKFQRLAAPILGERRASELARAADRVEQLRSMRELTELCLVP